MGVDRVMQRRPGADAAAAFEVHQLPHDEDAVAACDRGHLAEAAAQARAVTDGAGDSFAAGDVLMGVAFVDFAGGVPP